MAEPRDEPAVAAPERGPLERLATTPPGRLLSTARDRLRLSLADVATVLSLLLVAAFAVRVAWLDVPHGSLIFDEAYYVNAARVLLGWAVPAGGHYADSPAGLDPNTEHPPLGKLLIALSMSVFGDTGWAWRIPSVAAGMLSLGVVYRIARTSGETAWLAVLLTALVAFDNLTMIHGRIATLDILVLAPILVGSWLALRERWALAGVAMAIGFLVKLTALYGVAAVLLLYLLQAGGRWWRDRRIPVADLRGPVVFGLVFAVAGLAGLWLLDARFTTFATPFDHLQRMVEYGARLGAPSANVGFCPGADSRPWQWLFNECQIAYLRVDVTVRAGEQVISSVPSIDFRGALNPLLAGAIPLTALFVTWHAWRTGNGLARWAVAWGAANYLPYLVLAVAANRITYLYYMLPLVPAIGAATAILLVRSGLPAFVRWGFVAAYAAGFVAYFPFRQIP